MIHNSPHIIADNKNWHVDKMSMDVDGCRLSVEENDPHSGGCAHQEEARWKWVISYYDSVLASGCAETIKEAQDKLWAIYHKKI